MSRRVAWWAWRRLVLPRLVVVIARKGDDVYMLHPDQLDLVLLEGRRFDRGR
jgi:hypothetical protein